MARVRMVLVLLACLVRASSPCAQQTPNEPTLTRETSFQLPFNIQAQELPRLQEIQLYVSVDRGRTWKQYAVAQPEERGFTFSAWGDGEYWFTVASLYRDGKRFPASLTGAAPQKRILIDATPPRVELIGLNQGGNQMGIEWDVSDEDLDLPSLRAEYRPRGTNTWYPIQVPARAVGRQYLRAEGASAFEIRMRVRDRAGNVGLRQIQLGVPTETPAFTTNDPRAQGGQGNNFAANSLANDQNQQGYAERDARPAPSEMPPREPRSLPTQRPELAPRPDPEARSGIAYPSAPTAPTARSADSGQSALANERPMARPLNAILVNSTRFTIDYQVDQIGRSGLKSVELFMTRDTRTWIPYGRDDDKTTPFIVDVTQQGLYGLSLVCRNNADLGDDPPAPGDTPQIWVEVDITPPQIDLPQPIPNRGTDAEILTIRWNAQDRQQLAEKPISIFYSEDGKTQWQSIASNVPNTSQFDWHMPKDVPFKFHLRIEARDQAGNVGREETVRPVLIDFSRPRPKILSVKPSMDMKKPSESP